MSVVVYDQIDQLTDLRTIWSRLQAETPCAGFFQSLAWLETYWKHFGGDQQLRVLIVTERDRVSAIVPLVIRTESTKVGRVRFLTYPLDYWGSFYGPLGRDPQAALAAALEHLQRAKRTWDVLELRWIGAQQDDHERTAATLQQIGLAPVCSILDTTAAIDLQGSWAEYLTARGSKWRNNLQRWTRRIQEQGEMRYLRYRSPGPGSDPRCDLFDDCLNVARLSWQAASTNGTTISDEQIRSFIRDAHQAAADEGCIDMNLMYVAEKPVAFNYNYCYQGQVFGLRVGYDPSFQSFGVGNVLYARTIEDSYQRGDRRYDMGPGSLDAKRHLRTCELPVYRLSCFQRLSLRQQLLRWKRQHDMKLQKA